MSSKNMLNFIIHCTFWGICGILVLVFLQWGLPLVMPFAVGFLIALCVRPAVNRFQTHSPAQSSKLSLLILAFFYCLLLTAFILLILKGMLLIQNFLINFPDFYKQNLAPIFESAQNFFETLSSKLFPAQPLFLHSLSNGILHSLQNAAQQISATAVTGLAHFVTAFPQFIVNCGIAILCSFFVAWDYDKIRNFIFKHLSSKQKQLLLDMRHRVFISFAKTIKATLILCGITFLELLIGLTLLRVNHPIQTSFFIALVDILPVFGCGTIMIPWGLMQLISHNYPFGSGILILYAIITFIRQTIEPKILGKQLGIHPLAILFFMYIGSKLFGLTGLLFAPLIATIILQLWEVYRSQV